MPFLIDATDLEFYRSMAFRCGEQLLEISPPTLCPSCRLQRRLSFRNQVFVSRQNSAAGKLLFSGFITPPPFPLITGNEWWDEQGWSPEEYGREFDFSRPFFAQYKELSDSVPRPAMNGANRENSDFCNNCGDAKNCYFVFDAGYVEDCMYCDAAVSSRN